MEGLLLQQAKLIGLESPKANHKLPFGAVYAVGDNPASDIAGARAAGRLTVHYMACMSGSELKCMQCLRVIVVTRGNPLLYSVHSAVYLVSANQLF